MAASVGGPARTLARGQRACLNFRQRRACDVLRQAGLGCDRLHDVLQPEDVLQPDPLHQPGIRAVAATQLDPESPPAGRNSPCPVRPPRPQTRSSDSRHFFAAHRIHVVLAVVKRCRGLPTPVRCIRRPVFPDTFKRALRTERVHLPWVLLLQPRDPTCEPACHVRALPRLPASPCPTRMHNLLCTPARGR